MEQNRPTADFSHSYGITYIDAIDRQRRAYSKEKSELLSRYLEKDRNEKKMQPKIISMNGWANEYSQSSFQADSLCAKSHKRCIEQFFHKNPSIEKQGGFWINLGGKGIVVNPGNSFFERFHNQELHIWDIDHVIISSAASNSSSELMRIWNFNKEMNQMLTAWGASPHVIHYWLHPNAFDHYSAMVRPIYKQEQGSVHRLDIFQNSDTFEAVSLSPNLRLIYAVSSHKESSYAFQLEYIEEISDEKTRYALSFFLQTPWDEFFLPLLEDIQVLVLGIGDITFESITTLSPQKEKSLGYAGTIDLITNLYKVPIENHTDISPIILFCEYTLREGDFRIEMIKQMKHDIIRKIYEKNSIHILESRLCIVPSEDSISITLDNKVLEYAPGLMFPTPITDLVVLRSSGPFSKLLYCSKNSIL